MGLWRQVPEIAGGGSCSIRVPHMLNTIADLLGEDFVEVAARLDNRETPRGHSRLDHDPHYNRAFWSQ